MATPSTRMRACSSPWPGVVARGALTPGDFDLVKERVDIVQLVGERVALRRSGRSFIGLCPFHAEKTPSFHVDPDRRSYKCFGCGEGGDVFTWVEKQDGLDPVEALRLLAERAGVELTRRAPEEREGEKRLLLVHDTAHFYFRQAYRATEAGRAAAAYVAGRGITALTVDRFGLGYAPDNRQGLLTYLRKKGFSDDEAVTSGLIVRNERGMIDRFRDRVMVPLRDQKGRITAFAGRAMRADQPGKYVNSPLTPLFTKSAMLFALDLARPGMRKKGEGIIVEGQFDAIACHQAGFDNVVASMGTALTEDQYRILGQLKVGRAVVAFDGDSAGTTSAEKRGRDLVHIMRRYAAGKISTSSDVLVYVAPLPAGQDPDTLARGAPDALRAIFAAAQPVLEFVIEKIAARFDLTGPDGRRRFLAETLPLLADEPDELTRELYLGTLSRHTGLDQETLRRQAQATQSAPGRGAAPSPGGPADGSDPPERRGMEQASSLERYLVAQLIQFPEAAARVDLAPEDLADPELRHVFELLRSGRPISDISAPLAARVAALGALTPEPMTEADPGRAIEIAALRLREQSLRRSLGATRAALAMKSQGDDAGTVGREVARLGSELEGLMRSRERHTVLRMPEREEDE